MPLKVKVKVKVCVLHIALLTREDSSTAVLYNFGSGSWLAWANGTCGSTLLLLDRVMLCSHRLSVQTTVVSGTIWLQFAMEVLTGGCEPLVFWGRGGCRGWLFTGSGKMEMPHRGIMWTHVKKKGEGKGYYWLLYTDSAASFNDTWLPWLTIVMWSLMRLLPVMKPIRLFHDVKNGIGWPLLVCSWKFPYVNTGDIIQAFSMVKTGPKNCTHDIAVNNRNITERY